jgi:hypothetical protein
MEAAECQKSSRKKRGQVFTQAFFGLFGGVAVAGKPNIVRPSRKNSSKCESQARTGTFTEKSKHSGD